MDFVFAVASGTPDKEDKFGFMYQTMACKVDRTVDQTYTDRDSKIKRLVITGTHYHNRTGIPLADK
jgi:phytoene dehydrogenase-like protein